MKNLSLAEQIDHLADLTGAPDDFVNRIRSLFSNKGISLDCDSSPYVSALEQAFRKEQSLRLTAVNTREQLERLQSQLAQFNDTCRKQLDRLKELHESLDKRNAAMSASPRESSAEALHNPSRPRRVQVLEISEDGDVKVKRTRTILVPGPKERQ